jgi:hypothetical protein
MRRAITGYLATLEFIEGNLIQIDAVLKEHGIDSSEKLAQVSPATLGKWLGVDAVIYGDVNSYEAYYAFLISAWQGRRRCSNGFDTYRRRTVFRYWQSLQRKSSIGLRSPGNCT